MAQKLRYSEIFDAKDSIFSKLHDSRAEHYFDKNKTYVSAHRTNPSTTVN